MILTIKSATLEAGDYGDYMRVAGVDDNGKEVTKNIGEKFKNKWALLQENATVNIKMVQRDKKWYVDGIEPIEIEVDGTKITEQQVKPSEPKVAIAPQAIGMCTKEIGDMIRAKYLKPVFGDEASIALIKWYRGQIFGITRVNFDGAKLPQLETKKEE